MLYRMLLLSAAVVSELLLAGGCATHGPIHLDAPGEQRISAADAVDVVLSNEDKARVDDGLLTGEIWSRVFVGQKGRDPIFTIKAAHVRSTIAGMGFAMRFTYTIDGVFILDGREYPVHAVGTRAAALEMDSALRQAVELGVVDCARQVAAVVASRSQATKPPNQALEPTPTSVTSPAAQEPRQP